MKRALVIVEGARLERQFFNRFSEVVGLPMEIVVYATNIHVLYETLKETYGFNADIRRVLQDREADPEKIKLLEGPFAYTYLVYDAEIQHNTSPTANETELQAIRELNFVRLREMLRHFCDETDDTVGKLYINYPMMESFRDCDEFWDATFADRMVSVAELTSYKTFVSKRKLAARPQLKHYTRCQFESLMCMNVYKLNRLFTGTWTAPDYSAYRRLAEGSAVVDMAYRQYRAAAELPVLNTSLFMALDYFGNRDDGPGPHRFYYDRVVSIGKDG